MRAHLRRGGLLALAAGLVVLAAAVLDQPASGLSEQQVAFKKGPRLVGQRMIARHLQAPPKSRARGKDKSSSGKAEKPIQQRPVPKPKVKPTADAPARKTSSAAGSTDLAIFRDTVVATSNTSSIGEPTVGNDRNALLFTGNWHAAISTDNGLSWSPLDPEVTSAFPIPATGSDADSGAFCCDQVVEASDEDGNELVAWLMQYDVDSANDENTIRIATMRGREDIEETLSDYNGGGGVSEVCMYDFQPDSFDLPNSNRQLDFNMLQHSDEWLYVTSNVFKTSEEDNLGSVLWRIKLDDMTDSDCTLENGYEFFYDSTHFTASLVDGAGSTMWWATHTGAFSDSLRISWVGDSETTAHHADKGITPYTQFSDSDKGSCAYRSSNPCLGMSDRLLTGWTADGEIGWLWHARQGGDYEYPYVQGARFKTSDRSRVGEMFIYNDDFAWGYPAVGVASDGDLGVLLYKLGGNAHPKVRAFIIDSVTPSWSGIDTTAVVTSNYSPIAREFGHYGRVTAYDGCSETFLGAAYSMKNGSADTNDAAHQMVWFGRERDGCVDLTVSKLTANVHADGAISVTERTKNTGVATAGSSETRYYLSRDDEPQESNDHELSERHSLSTLAAEASDEHSFSFTPDSDVRAGEWHLFACADATENVTEISDSNNCREADHPVDVDAGVRVVSQDLLLQGGFAGLPGSASTGSKFDFTLTLQQIGPKTLPENATLEFYLSLLRKVDADRIRLLTKPITEWKQVPLPANRVPRPRSGRPAGGRPTMFEQNVSVSVTVPKSLAGGRYYVVACVTSTVKGADDIIGRNNCRATRTQILIRRAGQ